ncbi:hypothetical protein DL767_008364 [Monosporascus sp. MG133]|nr:hypothetical protein DL767_008364 [Monosporascus sp. MG133]
MDDLPYDPTDPMGFRRRAELTKRRSVQQGVSYAIAQKSEVATEDGRDGRNGRQDGERASQPQTERQMTTSIFAPPKQQQRSPRSAPLRLLRAAPSPSSCLQPRRKRADHYFALRDIRREVMEKAREKAARKEMEEDGNLKTSRPGFW